MNVDPSARRFGVAHTPCVASPRNPPTTQDRLGIVGETCTCDDTVAMSLYRPWHCRGLTERHTSPGASRSHTFAEDLRGSWDDDQRATAAEALLRSFSAGFVVFAVGAATTTAQNQHGCSSGVATNVSKENWRRTGKPRPSALGRSCSPTSARCTSTRLRCGRSPPQPAAIRRSNLSPPRHRPRRVRRGRHRARGPPSTLRCSMPVLTDNPTPAGRARTTSCENVDPAQIGIPVAVDDHPQPARLGGRGRGRGLDCVCRRCPPYRSRSWLGRFGASRRRYLPDRRGRGP